MKHLNQTAAGYVSLAVLFLFTLTTVTAQSPKAPDEMSDDDRDREAIWGSWIGLAMLYDVEIAEPDRDTRNPQARTRVIGQIRSKVVEAIASNPKKARERGFDGLTPLHYIARFNDLELANLVIANGADVNAQADMMSMAGTPIENAILYGNKQMVELLLDRGANIRAERKIETPPLHVAVMAGETAIVTMLLKRGADPNEKDWMNRTPLLIALQQSNEAMVNLLVSNGAEYDIFGAVESGDAKFVLRLIENDPEIINERDGMELTPLHIAALKNEAAIAEILINHGADIHAVSKMHQEATPLHLAASQGNLEVAECLMDHGARYNKEGFLKSTPVNEAASEGHVELMKLFVSKGAKISGHQGGIYILNASPGEHQQMIAYLVENGADVNVRSGKNQGLAFLGMTPLHWAAENGNIDIAKLLVENGAKINARDDEGETPLHLAARSSSAEMAKFLLDHGAEINAADREGRKPIDIALIFSRDEKDVEKLSVLVQYGAKLDVELNGGKTAFDKAGFSNLPADGVVAEWLREQGAESNIIDEIGMKRKDKVEEILRKNPELANFKPLHGYSPLQQTVWQCDHEIAEVLLNAGADISERYSDDGDRTALHWAVMYCDAKMVEMLLDRGMDVNIKSKSGTSPLHSAICEKKVEMVSLLLSRGAEVNTKDQDGETPLHDAASRGNVEGVNLLLANGADVNARNIKGKTVLHHAAAFGTPAIVRLLVERGADLDAKDNENSAPIIGAAWSGKSENIKALRECGATYGIVERVAANDLDGTKELIAKEPGLLNTIDGWKDTLLHTAAAYGNVEIAQYLIELGAYLEAKGGDLGRTPLHYAAGNGRELIIQLLLSKGADIDAQDNDGNTPLHLAAINCQKRVAELLLNEGADVSIRNRKLKTASGESFCKLNYHDCCETHWILERWNK